jgi:hypothetical protein
MERHAAAWRGGWRAGAGGGRRTAPIALRPDLREAAAEHLPRLLLRGALSQQSIFGEKSSGLQQLLQNDGEKAVDGGEHRPSKQSGYLQAQVASRHHIRSRATPPPPPAPPRAARCQRMG